MANFSRRAGDWVRGTRRFLATEASEGASIAESSQPEQVRGAWKWLIRKRVLDLLKCNDTLRKRGRNFPDFKSVERAAAQLSKVPEFQNANCIYLQKATPLIPVRALALTEKKQILLPYTGAGDGSFFLLDPDKLSRSELDSACKGSFKEFGKLGRIIKIDEKIKVDVFVAGCVAVDPSSGARLGMGEGTTDLEYALLRYMGAVNDSTPVITSVDEKQVVNELPAERMEVYDVPVDIICTSLRVIETKSSAQKPTGIYWNRLSPEKLFHFNVLRQLMKKEADKTQSFVQLAPPGQQLYRTPGIQIKGPSIQISGISPEVSEDELRKHLSELGICFSSLAIYRTRHMRHPSARVGFSEEVDREQLIRSINRSSLKGWRLVASCGNEIKKEINK